MLLFNENIPALVAEFCLHNFLHTLLQRSDLRASTCSSLLAAAGQHQAAKEGPAGATAELRPSFKRRWGTGSLLFPIHQEHELCSDAAVGGALSPAQAISWGGTSGVSWCSKQGWPPPEACRMAKDNERYHVLVKAAGAALTESRWVHGKRQWLVLSALIACCGSCAPLLHVWLIP